MIWVARAGKTYGPYPDDLAESYLASGQLASSDLAWSTGMTDWRPLNEVLGLSEEEETPDPEEGKRDQEEEDEPTNAETVMEAMIAQIGRIAIEPIKDELSEEQNNQLDLIGQTLRLIAQKAKCWETVQSFVSTDLPEPDEDEDSPHAESIMETCMSELWSMGFIAGAFQIIAQQARQWEILEDSVSAGSSNGNGESYAEDAETRMDASIAELFGMTIDPEVDEVSEEAEEHLDLIAQTLRLIGYNAKCWEVVKNYLRDDLPEPDEEKDALYAPAILETCLTDFRAMAIDPIEEEISPEHKARLDEITQNFREIAQLAQQWELLREIPIADGE